MPGAATVTPLNSVRNGCLVPAPDLVATDLGWIGVDVTSVPQPSHCRLRLITAYSTVMIPTIPDPSWMWQT